MVKPKSNQVSLVSKQERDRCTLYKIYKILGSYQTIAMEGLFVGIDFDMNLNTYLRMV